MIKKIFIYRKGEIYKLYRYKNLKNLYIMNDT